MTKLASDFILIVDTCHKGIIQIWQPFNKQLIQTVAIEDPSRTLICDIPPPHNYLALASYNNKIRL